MTLIPPSPCPPPGGRRPPGFQLPAPLPGELPRTHLLAELAQGRRLAALIAPAGYGKTTLLGQLARAAQADGQAVAWLTLTPEEADPARLAGELGRACAALPGFQPTAFEAARAAGGPPGPLAAALARDLNDLPHNALLVVDQTEVLGGAGAAWLGTLLASLGEGHRAAVAGFDLGPLRLGRVLAQGGLKLLDSERLAFTPEEAAQFCAGHPGLHTSAERWPLGLALSAAGAELGSALTPQAYQEELLDTLPPHLDELLDAAAVLPVWTTAEFRALELEPPGDWACTLLGAGLLLRAHGDGTYRPHELLVSALRARLDRRPQARPALSGRAAARAEAQGRPLEAIRLYLQAGQTARAVEAAQRSAPALEEGWAFDVLRQMLQSLPAAALGPDMQAKLCLCLLHAGEVVRAEALLRELRGQPEARAEALFLLSVVASRRGDSARQLALAEEGLGAGPSDRVRTRLMRVQASALNVLGRAADALPIAHEALALAQDTAQHGERAHLLALLNALHAFTRTPLAEREAVIQAGVRAYHRAGLAPACTRLHASLAYLYRLHGRAQDAWTELRAAQALEDQGPTPDGCLVLEAAGDLHRAGGDDPAARAAYEQALALAEAQGMTYLQDTLAYKLAELAVRAGQEALAHTWLTQARSWQYEQPGRWTGGAAQFYEGLFAALRGDPAAARHLRAALNDPRLGLEEQVRAHAWLLHLSPAGPLPADHLTALQELLSFLGGAAALQLDLPALAPLQVRVPGLLAGLYPPGAGAPPAPTAARRVQLGVSLLGGGVRVTVNGAPLRLAHSKPAELLAWLALHGPATREQLVDALVGGGTEQRHVEYVKVSVRRLRAVLSEAPGVDFNPLEFRAGQYLLSEAFEVAVDALTVRAARHSHDPAALTRALDAYAGPLLPRLDSAWADEARLELEEDLIACALRLAELVRGTDPALATRAYRRVLDLDPLQEEAAQALVELAEDSGRAGEARYLERVCQRRLEEGLGA
ncbi:AAA family ATPase [Deinococcus arcticus]|uniref:Bacterial transcriptional activator domain-containing protein n=1 Tax=Deinococcus arcticus TaxID=2136176 RepID=A0A2T3W5C3_9DEIO|nr:AAA family ATPase [Deinococcus arcticus]PTA66963.1 hypothetical protein C8263_14695 [Deinococcus arcticus]